MNIFVLDTDIPLSAQCQGEKQRFARWTRRPAPVWWLSDAA